jgi:hypothetical protein
MAHVDLLCGPIAGALAGLIWGQDAAAEDGEFISEVATVGGVEVAGVIPPLGLEIEVRAKVCREIKLARDIGSGKTFGRDLSR